MATMKTAAYKRITGNVHRSKSGGYAIVANKYPILATGKTFALAHGRFVRACNAYFDTDKTPTIEGGDSIEQNVYVRA